MLKPAMKFCKFDEYRELTRSLEFCLKIQGLIDGLRQLRSSNINCSLESIAKLSKLLPKEAQEEGKPRKRVHTNDPSKKAAMN